MWACTGPVFLALARAGQGVGGAVMFAASLALLAQAFQGRARGVAFGVFGAITGVAVAVGPVLGGVLTSGLSWRWIFFVNLPIGVAALAVTLLRVDESRDPNAFSSGLAALVFGLIRSADGWSSSTVVASLAAAGVLLAIFLAAERLQAAPMLDLRLLRVPTFNGGLTAAWAISASLFSLLTYLVLYLQNVLGLSPVAAGVRLLPLTGAIFFTAGIAGRLIVHVPRRLLIGPGFLLIGTGLLLMRGLTPASTWTHLLAGMIVSGVGAGLVNVPLVSTAVGVVEPARAGMASGINSTFRQIGIATGVAGLGAIFSSHIRSSVVSRLIDTPLAAHAHAVAHGISTGGAAQTIAATPKPLRSLVAGAARSAFVDGLNTILLVGAVVAFAAAGLSLALIRERDFVRAQEEGDRLAVAA